ncbi:MAG: 2-C-methyl-D-erythritol 4-phosphate cytidylyltransferase [Flavobacteriia bacterium]|nr:2-C-methyl-D-erythritol 4-phosphate cytidylyltransferase [Flavobacteriia bacterium]
MAKYSIIICAGGTGKRMLTEIPKQFLNLQQKAILQVVIEQFYRFDSQAQIIVTLPKVWINYWNEYCLKNNLNIPHIIIEGGKERYHSIKNALKHCNGDYIAVHDAVRPFVSQNLLKILFELVGKDLAVIPVISLKDSLRKNTNSNSKAEDRKHFVLVQTPQVFEKNILLKAYNQKYSSKITDDASLVEKSGVSLKLIDGEEKNIKITTPYDYELAQWIYKRFGI